MTTVGAPYSGPMCAGCMTTAATAAGAAAGLRAWMAARAPVWLTPARLKAASATLIAIAVSIAAVGSG